jgi:pimeloyl-ACP methyl ester carboxylesterase
VVPTIDCEGATFHYEERGAGAPLLMIAGTGGHAGMLSAVAERLAGSHRVITYDRRGHGRTVGPVGTAKGWFGRNVRDAAGLVRAVLSDGAAIFGWSWGGIVALGVAVEHPDLVRSLALYEPPLHAKKHMDLALASGVGGAVLLGKLGMHRRGATRFGRYALARSDGTNAFDDLDTATRESLLANARTMIVELEAGTGEELTADMIARIACPTAIIVGERSRRMFHEAARRLVAALPSARLSKVAGADHMINVFQPDDLARAIAEHSGGTA